MGLLCNRSRVYDPLSTSAYTQSRERFHKNSEAFRTTNVLLAAIVAAFFPLQPSFLRHLNNSDNGCQHLSLMPPCPVIIRHCCKYLVDCLQHHLQALMQVFRRLQKRRILFVDEAATLSCCLLQLRSVMTSSFILRNGSKIFARNADCLLMVSWMKPHHQREPGAVALLSVSLLLPLSINCVSTRKRRATSCVLGVQNRIDE